MKTHRDSPDAFSRQVSHRKLRRAADLLICLFDRRRKVGLPHPPKHVGVFLLDSKAMSKLKRDAWRASHRRTASSAGPVDVLAFPHHREVPYPEIRGEFLGDVYLNFELYGKKFDRLLFLLVHGILHLFGYQHTKKRDTIAMEELESTLWRHLSLLV